MQKSFFGYRRDNGRVGIRNHVLILPLDDLSQPACDAVANNIGGTVAIQHPYGRLQFGADLDLHFRTLIGAGSNPNVAAVIVIGIEEKWTQDVVDGIAKTGKPVAGFGIEQHGQIDTIARASRKAKEFVQYASALQKVECPISDLWVSCKCGESDTTSGIAANPTVGNAFDKLYENGKYPAVRGNLGNNRRRASGGPALPHSGNCRPVHEDVERLQRLHHRQQDQMTFPIPSRPRATFSAV